MRTDLVRGGEPELPANRFHDLAAESRHPRVFISYSHDSDAHCQWVLELSERLRLGGFETMIDRYVQGTPGQGWARWMENQVDWADFVLVVCTETYDQLLRGEEVVGRGKGVDWEGSLITNELYGEKSRTTKFVPILRAREDGQFVPRPLQAFTHYTPSDGRSYSELTDFLAGIAGVEPVPVGPLPPRERRRSTSSPMPENAKPAPLPAALIPDISTHVAPGGTMPADDVLYIERPADVKARAAASRRCETLVIKGPRQFGKSSLLNRYLECCRQSGKRVVYLDFSTFEEGMIATYPRFLSKLATLLANRLHSAPPSTEIRDQQEFAGYVESTLLPSLPGLVVFAFDETDRTLRQSYAADFFSMVRSWHNDRADPTSAWYRLGLALVSSSEPKLFIRDPMRSPFNVGERLELATFTLPEVASLNARYHARLSEMQCVELHTLLGGHPYLTQDAFYRLCGPVAVAFEELVADSAKDDGPFGAHLRATFANLQSTDGLLPALRTVIREGRVAEEQYYRLAGAGLVRKEGKRIVPANRIYRDFFGAF